MLENYAHITEYVVIGGLEHLSTGISEYTEEEFEKLETREAT